MSQFFEWNAVRLDVMMVKLVFGLMVLISKSVLASLARGNFPILVLASQYSLASTMSTTLPLQLSS